MMKEFGIWLGCALSFILLPIYFCWILACIGQGIWISPAIFSWSDGARASVVIWTIFATLVSIGAALQA